ncbi:MAG: endopeptidase La [Ruminococcaceae bacterium]|nr:endopeptidase La [Oscillospiraceae bacterium]
MSEKISVVDIEEKTDILPVLPLRGLNIFPNLLFHFDVGRKKSIKAIESAMANDSRIFLISQKKLKVEDPKEKDLYTVGTVAKVRQILKMPNDIIRVLIEGECRAKLKTTLEEEPYLVASVALHPEEKHEAETKKELALLRKVQEAFSIYANVSGAVSEEMIISVLDAKDTGRLCDYICQNIHLPVESKQAVLEQFDITKRANKFIEIITEETDIIEIENRIQDKVKYGIDKHQREYYLKEQIKAINDELGEGEDTVTESLEYRKKIEALGLPKEHEEKLLKEASRLAKMYSNSPESGVIRNYLDTVLDIPWGKFTEENSDIKKARDILEKEHYGMEKVKERILEIFAVKAIKGGITGQIICLAGPPGVGKTSIASSVAHAMGRNFARLSLGGVRDEAEIRGHRKTYIGAMPGRFVTALRQAKSSNCVVLVDEIDKLGNDYKGDPNSALLEVFDVEQNSEFRDHYVELPVDLSNVLFICTANDVGNIPRPLLDRMELIELGSYTDTEKYEIAVRHLIPKQLKKNGLNGRQFKLDKDALMKIIDGYTRESGVRVLERTLAKIMRKVAYHIVNGDYKSVKITTKNLKDYLGKEKYHDEKENMKLTEVGVINGLAYTSVGGEMLQIEVNAIKGTGKFEVTGNLGDVMKESVKAAVTYIRSRASQLGIDEEFYKNTDIHVHFPEGATPKDGPSAGIGIASAIISALTNTPVSKQFAMTGEITIRGRVLPIGGLREKTMAAYRNGIKKILVPEENRGDIDELEDIVKENIEFIFIKHYDEAIPVLFPEKADKAEGNMNIIPENAQVKSAAVRQ